MHKAHTAIIPCGESYWNIILHDKYISPVDPQSYDLSFVQRVLLFFDKEVKSTAERGDIHVITVINGIPVIPPHLNHFTKAIEDWVIMRVEKQKLAMPDEIQVVELNKLKKLPKPLKQSSKVNMRRIRYTTKDFTTAKSLDELFT